VPATVLNFPTQPTGGAIVVDTLKQAALVAAIIMAVMYLNNMTGQKLSTALAA
jgi:hypothetical protein